PAVRALAAQEPLVPAAARLDVSHRDQGLGTHLSLQRNGSRTGRTPCKWRCGRAGTVARPLDPRPTPPAQAGQGGDHVPHLLAPGAAPTSARAPGRGAAPAPARPPRCPTYTPASTSPPPSAAAAPNGSPSSGIASASVASGSRYRYSPARAAPNRDTPSCQNHCPSARPGIARYSSAATPRGE